MTAPVFKEVGGWGILLKDYQVFTKVKGHFVIHNGFSLLRNGSLLVERGYRWDFGTGAIDTPAVQHASLAHDALCEMISAGVLPSRARKAADKTYRSILKDAGMGPIRRAWQYYFIRLYVKVIKPFTG